MTVSEARRALSAYMDEAKKLVNYSSYWIAEKPKDDKPLAYLFDAWFYNEGEPKEKGLYNPYCIYKDTGQIIWAIPIL